MGLHNDIAAAKEATAQTSRERKDTVLALMSLYHDDWWKEIDRDLRAFEQIAENTDFDQLTPERRQDIYQRLERLLTKFRLRDFL